MWISPTKITVGDYVVLPQARMSLSRNIGEVVDVKEGKNGNTIVYARVSDGIRVFRPCKYNAQLSLIIPQTKVKKFSLSPWSNYGVLDITPTEPQTTITLLKTVPRPFTF